MTASAIGTVSRIAPGRTFIGIGSGYTGRQTFGLGPVAAGRMRDYARDCRDLLQGRPVKHKLQTSEREIRFRHKPGAYVDLEQEIPIYVGADGPKALQAAGRGGRRPGGHPAVRERDGKRARGVRRAVRRREAGGHRRWPVTGRRVHDLVDGAGHPGAG